MANEISLSIALKYKNGSVEENITFSNVAIDVSGDALLHHIQAIGTSEEALTLGDVTTGGYFVAKNRDTTNFVEIRSGTGATDVIKLKAGEVACFRMSGDSSAPYAIADTAAVNLEYWLFSD